MGARYRNSEDVYRDMLGGIRVIECFNGRDLLARLCKIRNSPQDGGGMGGELSCSLGRRIFGHIQFRSCKGKERWFEVDMKGESSFRVCVSQPFRLPPQFLPIIGGSYCQD